MSRTTRKPDNGDAMTNPTKRRSPDWEAIERTYRAGMLSVREIARQHGVSDTAVRKRATEHGWQRDLAEKVKEAVRSKLVRTEVRTPNARTEDVRTEREIVDEASDLGVGVFRLHQRNARQGRELLDVLMAQLIGAAGNRDAIIADIYEDTAYADAVGKKVDAGQRAAERTRRKAMLAAVSLSQHAVAFRDLVTAMDKLHPIELRSHGLSDMAPPDPPEADEQSPSLAALAAFDARLAELTAARHPPTSDGSQVIRHGNFGDGEPR